MDTAPTAKCKKAPRPKKHLTGLVQSNARSRATAVVWLEEGTRGGVPAIQTSEVHADDDAQPSTVPFSERQYSKSEGPRVRISWRETIIFTVYIC